MIKVLHVTHTYLPYIGGASLRLRNLIEPLAKDCEIHVLNHIESKEKLSKYEIINGIHVHRVKSIYNILNAVKFIIKKYNIDIIHTHNPRLALLSYLAFSKKPIIYEIHSLKAHDPIKAFFSNRVYSFCKKVIVLSESMANEIKKEIKVPSENIKVIYNGIELERFSHSDGKLVRSIYGISDNSVVGYLGTFFNWQGVIDLIKAFDIVSKKKADARLLMVGGGPELDNMKNLISQLGLDEKVVLTGKVPPEKAPDYISAMDVFAIVRPKMLETETAVPLKVLEAMAAKRPIIITRLNALLEVFEEGVNAIVAEPGNIEEIAELILLLLEDKALQTRLAENARKAIEEKFSWQSSSNALLECYKEIIHENITNHEVK